MVPISLSYTTPCQTLLVRFQVGTKAVGNVTAVLNGPTLI
jgi:hypothetical protein